MNYEDYVGLLKIDKNDLDTELIRQTDLFNKISLQFVEAASIRDEKKKYLQVVEAELRLKIKKEFDDDGRRVTEKTLDAMIITDPIRLKANKIYQEAKLKCDKYEVLKESFRQRSYMLRELISLFISDYYSIDAVRKKGSRRDEQFYDLTREKIKGSRRGKTYDKVESLKHIDEEINNG